MSALGFRVSASDMINKDPRLSLFSKDDTFSCFRCFNVVNKSAYTMVRTMDILRTTEKTYLRLRELIV